MGDVFLDSATRGGEFLDRLAARRQPDRNAGTPTVGSQRLPLVTVEQLCRRPRPKWLVRGLIPEKALGVIYGEPGSGKTFLVLDLALAVTRGAPWLGLRTRQGGVVYVACEGALRNRVEAYLSHQEVNPEDLPQFRIIESNVNLLDPDADLAVLIERLKEVGRQTEAVFVVVIDTLNRAMSGGNENAPDDMGAMIAAAAQITEKTGATVVFVHHCGKDANRGSRGHSSLKGAADFEMSVTVGEKGARCAEVVKVKDGETGQRFGFRLVSVDLGPSDDPEADPDERISSCVIELAEAAPRAVKQPRYDVALNALREAVQEHGERMPGTSAIPAGMRAVRLEQWRNRWRLRTGDDYTTEESAAAAFRRERKNLLESGKVQCLGQLVWIN